MSSFTKKFLASNICFNTVAILVTSWLCVNIGNSVFAQETQYPYQKYEDRKEGIIKPRQLVAGEKLVLLSASIAGKESKPAGDASSYHFGFYLSDSSRLKIEIREYEFFYKMEPLRKKYPSGLYRFSWPSEIPSHYEIAIKDLYPLATVSGSGGQTLVPMVLFYEAPQGMDLNYRFSFIPRNAVSLLEYRIYNNNRELIYSAARSDLNIEEKVHLSWAGKDQKNQPVSKGMYELVIKTTFEPRPGTLARQVTSKYKFYHYPELFTDIKVQR